MMSESSGSDIPEGETRQTSNHTFTKHLPAIAFSHYESRDEVRELDYTPTINRRPVDLNVPLRVRRMGRTIRAILCITMYNEEADELRMSLRAVSQNLDALEAGGLMWHEFLVIIIVDGREKMSKSVAEFAEKELKVWDSSMLKYEHRNNEVTCHIFEKTVDLPKHSSQREYYKPLQIVMAVKEKNGGKLNSHLWYFSAFAKQLQPDYVFLLDVGTCPRPGALWMLFDAMQKNPQVGGVCGEIAVRNPRIYNLIEASQHFEYKVSHVMDKAMESVFGYVSVLPGAFSAYRWKAVRGEPLNSYFFVEENSVKEMGPFLANMYLAEDRVLCFELLAKENRTWTLHFVTGAVAETDVPETLLELLKQRRRWLNGSFFSLVYFVSKFHHLLSRSDHSWFRRLGLVVQFFYQLSSLIMSWFAVGSLYLSLVVIFNLALERLGDEASTQIMWVFSLSYGFLTFLQLMLGLGSKPHEVIKIYFMCSLGYGLIMSFASALSAWHLASGAFSSLILFASTGSFLCYLLSSLLHGEMLTMIVVFPQYLYMLPTYVNMFSIFSFCNMHDISWGTKEGNLAHQAIQIRRRDGPANQRGPGARRRSTNGMEGKGRGGRNPDERHLTEAEREARRVIAEAAAKAEEDAMNAEIERRKAKLAADQAAVAKDFMMFRTRLLAAWVICNCTYVSVVVHFNFLSIYGMAIAVLIFWTLFFRMIGSIVYQLERLVKAFWSRCCFWCCFRCCWEKHYGGIIHNAARVQAGKTDDDQTDSEVSEYENDDDDDRWGAVSFDSEEEDMDSEYSDEDSYDSRSQNKRGGNGNSNIRMMDLSQAVAAADAASAAVLKKCDDFTVETSVTGYKEQVVRTAASVDAVSVGRQSRRPVTGNAATMDSDLSEMIAQSERVADAIAQGTPRK